MRIDWGLPTVKMNDVDPQAWLADGLARIEEHPAQRLDELLPWNWRQLNVRDSQRRQNSVASGHWRHYRRAATTRRDSSRALVSTR
jgi:IS66 C-terminal element